MNDGPEWFAPRRYGYGAGPPISWQGWAVSIAYSLVIAGLVWKFHDRPLAMWAALVPPTAIFIVITAHTTRGGWRWRWGDED